MGLDVYVGSLTRYYSGDWESVVEQAAREQGLDFHVIRVNEPAEQSASEDEFDRLVEDAVEGLREGSSTELQREDEKQVRDPQEIREAVDAWRGGLSTIVDRRLEWNESVDSSYFTDKPAWDGYGSLQILAAYVEQGRVRKLPKKAVSEWAGDRHWRKAAENPIAHYAHLYAPELWLPVDFPWPVEARDVAGNPVVIGSSMRLLLELQALNEKIFRATEEELERWRREGAEAGGPFQDGARFGFAVFLYLTDRSVEERLPMRLDY